MSVLDLGKYLLISMVLMLGSGCIKKNEEVRYVDPASSGIGGPDPKLTKAGECFLSARDFASGKTAVTAVQEKFNTLSDTDVDELLEMGRSPGAFIVLMAIGKASNESGVIIDKSFKALGSGSKSNVVGEETLAELLKKNRHKDEEDANRKELIKTVLTTFPLLVNNLKEKGNFNVELLAEFITNWDGAKIVPLIEKLDANYWDEFLAWAAKNPSLGHTAIDAATRKVPGATKNKINSFRLRSCINDADLIARQACIEKLIDDMHGLSGPTFVNDDYELKLGATKMSGTLMLALVQLAIYEHYSLGGAAPLAAYARLRIYMLKIAGLVTASGGNFGAMLKTSAPGTASVSEVLSNALSPIHYQDWSNYYLASESIADAFNAGKNPQVSNRRLREIYDYTNATLVPATPDKAQFLRNLVGRKADADLAYLVDAFLTKASGGVPANELPLLKNIGGGKNAVQIISQVNRPAGEDAIARETIFYRLLDNDDGTAIVKLDLPEITAWAKRAFSLRGFGGHKLFNTVYDKLLLAMPHASAIDRKNYKDRLEAMRNTLLADAVGLGSQEIYFFVDDVTKNRWHLLNDIDTDLYTLNTIVNKTLPFVLATYAKEQFVGGNLNALNELRRCFALLKNLKGPQYNAFLTNNATNGESIVKVVKSVLSADKIYFTNYYLANESPKDVYDAALDRAQIPNGILKELYQLVIGTAKLTHELSREPNGPGDRFLHHLLRREINNKDDLVFLVSAYLKGINEYSESIATGSGIAAEKAQTALPDSTGKVALHILTLRPNTYVDDPYNKRLIMRRLLAHEHKGMLTGMTAGDLAAIMSFLANEPAFFSTIYRQLNPLKDRAKAMRSALLKHMYAQGRKRMVQFLGELTDANDKWNLKNSVFTVGVNYDFENLAPANPVHNGSLFYVLTAGAIDRAATTGSAYRDLREYLTVLKTSHPGNYNSAVNINVENGNTIRVHLHNSLPPGQRHFTNTFLAQEGVQDVYDAVQEAENVVDNAKLKNLYLLVIGYDGAKALALAGLGAMASNKFIHHLLMRSSSPDLAHILLMFLDSLGGGNERGQLNDQGTGRYPIQILADAARAVVNDDPLSKAKMFDRLLTQDNGVAVGAVLDTDLKAQRCFLRAGNDGMVAFVKLMGKLTNLQKIGLRNALIAEALENKLLAKLMDSNSPTAITHSSDPWTLRATLSTDIYSVPSADSAAPPGTEHVGPLIYGLTKHAIETANKPGNDYSAYLNLRAISVGLRSVIEVNRGDYVNYVKTVANGETATGVLKAELDKADHYGLAEYFLDLDGSFAAFDENLVFRAAKNKERARIFESSQLQWIYQTGIDTDNKAGNLSALISNGTKFLHLMTKLKSNKDGFDMLDDYLKRLERLLGSAGVNLLIAEIDPALNKNALAILTNSKGGGGRSVYRNQMINLLASFSTTAIQTVPTEDTDILLSAVLEYGKQANLTHVIINATDLQIADAADPNAPSIARWVASKKEVIDRRSGSTGMIKVDNLEDPDVRPAFIAGMTGRGHLNNAVKNALLRSAFEVGSRISGRKALDRVAKLIDSGLIADGDLIALDFDPFKPKLKAAVPDGLLRSVLMKTSFNKQEDLAKIIAKLRPKFVNLVDWQNYLDYQPGGGLSIVQELAKRLNNDLITAKFWLSYTH